MNHFENSRISSRIKLNWFSRSKRKNRKVTSSIYLMKRKGKSDLSPIPSLFPFLPTPYPFRRLLRRTVSSLFFFCVISNDCVIIRSVTGTFNHRLVNQPFLFLHHPWLGTRLRVSSVGHVKVWTSLCFKPAGEERNLCSQIDFFFLGFNASRSSYLQLAVVCLSAHRLKNSLKRVRAFKVIPWFCTAHLLLRITRWPP